MILHIWLIQRILKLGELEVVLLALVFGCYFVLTLLVFLRLQSEGSISTQMLKYQHKQQISLYTLMIYTS